MSKTNKKHQRSRAAAASKSWRHSWWAAVLLILLIIAIILGIIFIVKPINPTVADPLQPESSPSTTEPSASTPDENIPDPTPTSAPEAPESKTPHYEGQNPNTLHELTGIIATAYVENGSLKVIATINQYLQSDGTCTLTLTSASGATYTATAPATPDVTSSICGMLEIPAANLRPGKYQASIKLEADGKTGFIEKEIEL